MKHALSIFVLAISMLLWSACSDTGVTETETSNVASGANSEPSGSASEIPEYKIMSEEDFPLEDTEGSIPAKSLVVHTEESSDLALQQMMEDVSNKYPDQDVVGGTFGNMLDTDGPETYFVVMVRDERAARVMGLNAEEFTNGGIVVNPQGAEQAAQNQYEASDASASEQAEGQTRENTVPAEPQTPDEKIRQKVEKTFIYPNKDIEELVVQDDGTGCYAVNVTHKATTNLLSAGVYIDGLELQAADIYETIYVDRELADIVCNITVDNITVDATTELTDEYGNASNEVVYSTAMDSATASQIQWQNSYSVDFPSVWTLNYIHPAVERQMAEEQLQEEIDCAADGGMFDFDVFCE